ncbi:MAG: ATP-binding protein, partial [Pseudomonadota bacterium]
AAFGIITIIAYAFMAIFAGQVSPLGLAITQKLVDAMGGAIQVDSKLGVGTSFRVKLTLQPAAAGQPR